MFAELKIQRGVLYHIDSIKIRGTARLRNGFLYRYLEIPKGSIYNEAKLQNVNKRISDD